METFFRVVGHLLVFGVLSFLYACTLSDDDPPPAKITFNATIKIIEPKAITSSSLNLPDIEGFLTVDQNTTIATRFTFHLRDGLIAPISMKLREGIHTFQVDFDVHNTPYGVVRLLESDLIRLKVDAVNANNVLILDNYGLVDTDKDGVDSLEELDLSNKLEQDYNPYDSNSTPPSNPIRISHKLLHFSDPVEKGMTITWQSAKHKIPGMRIEYQLVYSAADDLNTIDQFTAKPIYKEWSTDTFATVQNISAAHTAFWNVQARDEDKNKDIYTSATANGLGILDKSFATDGYRSIVTSVQNPFGNEGRALAISSKKGIIVVGRQYSSEPTATSTATSDIIIWRFEESGVNDFFTSRPDGAVYKNPRGFNSDDKANAITVDGNNKIIVTGQSGASDNFGDRDMIVFRIFESGKADSSFGGPQGFVTSGSIKGPGLSEVGNAITIDNAGRILVAGTAETSALKRVIVVWRYDAFGILDTENFGFGKGYIIHNGLGGDINTPLSTATAIAVDAFDNIVVAGSSINIDGNTDMALWKFDNAGRPLDNFGDRRGLVVHDSSAGGGLNDMAYSLIIDSKNRILVSGTSSKSATAQAIVVWRFSMNGQLDTSFADNKGYWMHNIGSGNRSIDRGYAIALDKHENIIVAGSSESDSNNVDSAVWRLTPNGILDTRFASGVGYVVHNNTTNSNPLSEDYAYALAIKANGKIITSGVSQNNMGAPNMTLLQYQ
ncbi:MAG: hypothetical protein ACC707_10385 [Thiohalomonadales bacterium]